MLTLPKHFPANPDKFEFDEEVAPIFDDMALRSIPGYGEVLDMMRSIVASKPLPDWSQVWDFGCSTGNALGAVSDGCLNPRVSYFGVDQSPHMLKHVADKVPHARLLRHDLSKLYWPQDFVAGQVSVMIFNWTLQFLEDKELRRLYIQQAWDALAPGGLLFVCEKFRFSDPDHETAMQNAYLWYRRMNGYSVEEIRAKSLALSNSMWPWTHEELEEALAPAAGHYKWLYRMYNFGGIVARKPE